MHFYWETMVFAIIAFGILYVLLNKYVFKKLFAIMEQRNARVLGELSDATNSKTQAEALLAEQKALLDHARTEAADLIAQARTMAAKLSEMAIDEAKSEARRMREVAMQDIAREQAAVAEAMRQHIGQLAVLIAAKLIEKEIDAKAQAALIERALREVHVR
ncbi:MAG: F0F1 ATP synthase subunit B [Paenibacillaceae bacterium]|nr:F0F1 ATP synthase subunit B [Paenibacillaceae bacterium]